MLGILYWDIVEECKPFDKTNSRLWWNGWIPKTEIQIVSAALRFDWEQFNLVRFLDLAACYYFAVWLIKPNFEGSTFEPG